MERELHTGTWNGMPTWWHQMGAYREHPQGSLVVEPKTGRTGVFSHLKSTLADTTMMICAQRMPDHPEIWFEADISDVEVIGEPPKEKP